jgi:uncharacterized protein
VLKFEKPLSFNWDKGNVSKNLFKHDVTNLECEEVFTNLPLVLEDNKHSKLEKRFWSLGVTNRFKYLHITFTLRGKSIRIISARPMSRKERSAYEKAKKAAKI